jgi:hypothetical protein
VNNAPKDLDLISDVVLNYRPKEKAKATKQRAKKRAKACHEEEVRYSVLMYIIPHRNRGLR